MSNPAHINSLTGAAGERKVAMTSHTITVVAKPASEKGALDGHQARCTCGFTHGTSLGEREARKLGREHVEWARRTGR